ncbi:MAG: sensor histidine kinase [Desulfovibrio sp.]|nr:sensor histidine kinase [Desulfovibrio sp.]MBI4959643.1 sensor histidine kinase [Desulfovibrio sp.]
MLSHEVFAGRAQLPRKVILASLLLAVLFVGHSWATTQPPTAQQGILDLSSWNPTGDGSVKLDGEWEFYWGQLLTPDDFTKPFPTGTINYIPLPSAWNGFKLDGVSVESEGYATFRLKIVPAPINTALALRLLGINSAFRLWLNGSLLAQGGTVGKSVQTELPNPSPVLVLFQNDRPDLELVLQVSNHTYRQGGILSSVCLGPEALLMAEHTRPKVVAFFFTGSLLIMGIYHLALYGFRRSNIPPLYFGFYCLLWSGNHLTSDSSEWAILSLLPGTPFVIIDRISWICFILSVPVGYLFFKSLYPQYFSTLLMRLSQIFAVIFTLIAILFSSIAFTSLLPIYYLISSILILYCLIKLHNAKIQGEEGATFILAGFLILGLVGINDMLNDFGAIHTAYLLPVGMFSFILFQSFALSLRFSRAFAAVERLSSELECKNVKLVEEIQERARLEREVISISEQERRRISHDLHDGLCQQLTGARLRCSVLESKLAATLDNPSELSQLSTLLDESVNHAYDLSRGLWPVEHDPKAESPSLEELVRRFADSSGISIEFRKKEACDSCSNEHITQLYRIAQEAISNAVKHARARKIDVTLTCTAGDAVTLSVRDDGIGRSKAKNTRGGLGIGIMKHRARLIGGILTIDDTATGGTLVTCTAFCSASRAKAHASHTTG